MACFGHQFFDRFIKLFPFKVFVANDAFCVDQIGRRPTCDIPFCCDGPEGTLFAIPETTPIDF